MEGLEPVEARRSGARCSSTPWLWAYWPVRNVARDGQQSEKLTKLFANVTPWSPISELTLCITFIDSRVWSSVSITTMFGLPCAAADRLAQVRVAASRIRPRQAPR